MDERLLISLPLSYRRAHVAMTKNRLLSEIFIAVYQCETVIFLFVCCYTGIKGDNGCSAG